MSTIVDPQDGIHTQLNRSTGALSKLHYSYVFIWAFALSSIWHYASSGFEIFSFILHFNPQVTPLIFVAILSASVAILMPGNAVALAIFSVGQLIAILGRMPQVADHLVMEAVLHLAILSSLGVQLWHKRKVADLSVAEAFEAFAPVGRWLLIVMYFFGTFHKINPGFLEPVSSCALPFIEGFHLPDSIVHSAPLQYAAIYGTLIFEFLAMLLLLNWRTKYFGMLLGIPFHYIIGISGYGTLAHFSSFALALHLLFVSPRFGERLLADHWIPQSLKSWSSFRWVSLAIILLQLGFALHLGFTRAGYLVNTLFGIYGAIVIALVIRHGRHRAEDGGYRLRSSILLLNLLPVIFFIHCTSPYIGLGTGGTLQMFSGLRTEAGQSNHYMLPELPQVFPYQDEVVYIERASNPSLQSLQADEQGMVLFDFQRHITERETLVLPITLRVADQRYEITDLASLQRFIDEHFTQQSWFERHYLSFRLVDEMKPDRCRH